MERAVTGKSTSNDVMDITAEGWSRKMEISCYHVAEERSI